MVPARSKKVDPDMNSDDFDDVPEKQAPQGYTFAEDMAIVKYMTENKRYLLSSGIKVWKDAEEMRICPGRPYLSMKERYRKIIVKDLKKYKVDTDLVRKITEFMRATKEGKRLIRLKESS